MSAAGVLCGLWLLFGGSHMLLSGPARPGLLGAVGEKGFLGLYSLVAFATFVPLLHYYSAHKHAGPMLWSIPAAGAMRHLLYLGNTAAFVLMAAALMTRSPMMVGGPAVEPRGIHYITRHGLFMGVALWALMHLVPNGFASDVVFFGGFVLFAWVGCWHQDRRKLRTGGEAFRRFHERTAFIPFTGRNTLRGLKEISIPGVVVGIGVALALRYFHAALFT